MVYGYGTEENNLENLILCPYCREYFKESEWRTHIDECQFVDSSGQKGD